MVVLSVFVRQNCVGGGGDGGCVCVLARVRACVCIGFVVVLYFCFECFLLFVCFSLPV